MHKYNTKAKCYVCKDLGKECNLEEELNFGLEPQQVRDTQRAIAKGLGIIKQ